MPHHHRICIIRPDHANVLGLLMLTFVEPVAFYDKRRSSFMLTGNVTVI